MVMETDLSEQISQHRRRHLREMVPGRRAMQYREAVQSTDKRIWAKIEDRYELPDVGYLIEGFRRIVGKPSRPVWIVGTGCSFQAFDVTNPLFGSVRATTPLRHVPTSYVAVRKEIGGRGFRIRMKRLDDNGLGTDVDFWLQGHENVDRLVHHLSIDAHQQFRTRPDEPWRHSPDDRVNGLTQSLRSSRLGERSDAAYEILQAGLHQTLPPLIAALRDEWVNVRIYAAQAIGATRPKEAIKPLLASASDPDENAMVRHAAVVALSQAGEKTPISSLVAIEEELGDCEEIEGLRDELARIIEQRW